VTGDRQIASSAGILIDRAPGNPQGFRRFPIAFHGRWPDHPLARPAGRRPDRQLDMSKKSDDERRDVI
jgi:hypothetical protein